MRVISGTLKNRTIHETHGHRTHPMSEKMRGALFNALGDIEGLTVLDAFAGTGALSIEAVSRGAANVVCIDNDIEAARAIQKNIADVPAIRLYTMNARTWSDQHGKTTFDIVLLDPPYDDINENLLMKLASQLKKNGLLVVSIPSSFSTHFPCNFSLLRRKKYGDALLDIYRKTE